MHIAGALAIFSCQLD